MSGDSSYNRLNMVVGRCSIVGLLRCAQVSPRLRDAAETQWPMWRRACELNGWTRSQHDASWMACVARNLRQLAFRSADASRRWRETSVPSSVESALRVVLQCASSSTSSSSSCPGFRFRLFARDDWGDATLCVFRNAQDRSPWFALSQTRGCVAFYGPDGAPRTDCLPESAVALLTRVWNAAYGVLRLRHVAAELTQDVAGGEVVTRDKHGARGGLRGRAPHGLRALPHQL